MSRLLLKPLFCDAGYYVRQYNSAFNLNSNDENGFAIAAAPQSAPAADLI
jgi:hypothetical protein